MSVDITSITDKDPAELTREEKIEICRRVEEIDHPVAEYARRARHWLESEAES